MITMKVTILVIMVLSLAGHASAACSPQCSDGDVCGNRYGSGNSCTSAAGICGDHEYAEAGRCKSCPTGEESIDNLKTSCTLCPDGQVRGNRYGSGSGGCMEAGAICGDHEYAEAGRCKSCPTGQVSYDDLLTSCTVCPDGTVRGNRYGSGSGGCVPGVTICGAHEYAEDGKCKTCGAGKANVGFCELCPDGWVRGNRYGTGSGGCVPAFMVCGEHEYGMNGKCKSCGAGLVANAERTGCGAPCPDGQVRGNRYGTGSGGCVVAGNICGDHEYAEEGKCKTCPTGQVSYDDLRTSCTLCLAGRVRGNRYGSGSGGCIEAGAICGDHEYAEDGRCKTCPTGQVSIDNIFTSCNFCPDGTVRTNRYGTGSGGCISASLVCNAGETGSGGKCVSP